MGVDASVLSADHGDAALTRRRRRGAALLAAVLIAVGMIVPIAAWTQPAQAHNTLHGAHWTNACTGSPHYYAYHYKSGTKGYANTYNGVCVSVGVGICMVGQACTGYTFSGGSVAISKTGGVVGHSVHLDCSTVGCTTNLLLP